MLFWFCSMSLRIFCSELMLFRYLKYCINFRQDSLYLNFILFSFAFSELKCNVSLLLIFNDSACAFLT